MLENKGAWHPCHLATEKSCHFATETGHHGSYTYLVGQMSAILTD